MLITSTKEVMFGRYKARTGYTGNALALSLVSRKPDSRGSTDGMTAQTARYRELSEYAALQTISLQNSV